MAGVRVYGLEAGDGLDIDGTVAPATVQLDVPVQQIHGGMGSTDSSLVLEKTLHVLGDFTDLPGVYIGPWTDSDGTQLQKSLGIDHRYNVTGGPSAVASPIRVYTLIEGAPNFYVWASSIEMDIRTEGNSPGEHVGYAITTRRLSGATPSFLYYGSHHDFTGLAAQVGSQSVGFELDISVNGNEAALTAWDPTLGARCSMAVNGIAQAHPGWVGNTAYAKGAVVFASPYNAYTYVAQNAGTSGAAQPAWPTTIGNTIVDGTVTWLCGTTGSTQISRAIHIAAPGNAAFGAGVLLDGNYYDAPIDMSWATLRTDANPNAAGLRLAPNMAIDFSGQRTQATQNLRIMVYNSPSQELVYRAGGFVRFAIHDDGPIRIQPPLVNCANDTLAAGAGVPVGGIYRNASALMVRVT